MWDKEIADLFKLAAVQALTTGEATLKAADGQGSARSMVDLLALQSRAHFLNHSYTPVGTNRVLWDSRDGEVIISGAAGTGKSRCALEKLHKLCEDYPGTRALIVRKTRESLSESGLYTFEVFVLGEDHPMLKTGGKRRMRQKYEYPNGSEIVVGGMDKPTKIMSTEFDIIFVQEAIELTLEDWESLTTRLRSQVLPFRQIIGDTNPSSPLHWIKRREAEGYLRLLNSRHEDNPILYRDGEWTEAGRQYIQVLDRLTGVRKDRLRYGRWVQAEGVVYPIFDPAVHILDRTSTLHGLTGNPAAPIPQFWRRFRVIDFGYSNPFVCLWAAVDPEGRIFVYREIYMTKKIVSEHAKTILRYDKGVDIEATICDHDREDRETLKAAGIYNQAARKDILSGIDAVLDYLAPDDQGFPKLYFLRGSLVEVDRELLDAGLPTKTVDEFDSYVWAVPKSAARTVKEAPVKENDHGMDTVRYLVKHLATEIDIDPERYAQVGQMGAGYESRYGWDD